MAEYPKFLYDLRYPAPLGARQTRLHTVDVVLPRAPDKQADKRRIWLIYIHGGAWRNPHQTSHGFQPAIRQFLKAKNKDTLDSIAAFASPNYRLSHNAEAPTPDDSATWARHPDHLNDVLSALEYLHQTYDVGSTRGYILVGGSSGATLTYQVGRAFGAPFETSSSVNIPAPLALIGLGGIYNLALLIQTRRDIPLYREFVAGAFGNDEQAWNRASPAKNIPGAGGQIGLFGECTALAVLVHADGDEVVDADQKAQMEKVLIGWVGPQFTLTREEQSRSIIWRASGEVKSVRTLVSKVFTGSHEELWEAPKQMVECITEAIHIVGPKDSSMSGSTRRPYCPCPYRKFKVSKFGTKAGVRAV
ncbi:MAG: hypothetical protein MMC33_004676 [Icmadophila ericetorum]|nr:hypothetical protein [Icmadophila ericetorum]